MTYDELLDEYDDLSINEVDLSEVDPEGKLDGLYSNGKIIIRKDLPTTTQKACILAEEIGHYYTTAGNILDPQDTENQKKENIARAWAYEQMVPLSALLEAYWAGLTTRYELAEFLDVTEPFLQDSLDYYREKHGEYYAIDNYLIYFDPLAVLEMKNGKLNNKIQRK